MNGPTIQSLDESLRRHKIVYTVLYKTWSIKIFWVWKKQEFKIEGEFLYANVKQIKL